MIKTLSLFPRKTAQPPLVGKTARTCTSITVLFIRANRNRAVTKNKRGGSRAPSRAAKHRAAERSIHHQIFATRACMFAALIDYALCGCRRPQKNEDRVGR